MGPPYSKLKYGLILISCTHGFDRMFENYGGCPHTESAQVLLNKCSQIMALMHIVTQDWHFSHVNKMHENLSWSRVGGRCDIVR